MGENNFVQDRRQTCNLAIVKRFEVLRRVLAACVPFTTREPLIRRVDDESQTLTIADNRCV